MMSGFVVVNKIGMWFGYVTFGIVSDASGRKRSYVDVSRAGRTCSCWAYTSTRNLWVLLVLGPITAFFATGYFSGFGAVTAEIYPTGVRATAQGFTYNIGRVASAFAPAIAGSVARTHGYPAALAIAAAAFVRRDVFLDLHSGDEGAENPIGQGTGQKGLRHWALAVVGVHSAVPNAFVS